ncbi:MAG: helix-turn-helix domain containing protein [Proteobacteria bacterium]|nr:helix-turn-helix domain containing protein [Pseudomonadota bacterium]
MLPPAQEEAMPRRSPFQVEITDSERCALEASARSYTSPYRDVIRAKIVLYAAQGFDNDEIAQRLDTPRQIFSKWRKRFFQQRLAGLEERPRHGRPARFPPNVVAKVKALACELPTVRKLPLSRLSIADIRQEALREGIVASIGEATIWRWLSQDAVRPWFHRTWIFPRDPSFPEKAARVLDLYEKVWEGTPLRPDEFVVSADEKTSIQARRRIHRALPVQPGKPLRV